MAEKARIIFAAHKPCPVPSDPLYLPLFLGAALVGQKGGEVPGAPFQRDDEGENISEKNRCFGSLTGLYWAWKHLETPYVGLVHYRRYFLEKKPEGAEPFSGILTEKTLEAMLTDVAVFVPKRRKYYIETLYSHYGHTMNPTHLDIVRDVISERSPEYIPAFDRVMKQRWGYMFNMTILRRDLLDHYCAWLFEILFETEKRIGHAGMSEFENRYCGRISERLLNVWLRYMLDAGLIHESDIRELPYTEQVNFRQKVWGFLKAKLFHQKYTQSS